MKTINPVLPVLQHTEVNRTGLFTRYNKWLANQESNRLLWTGISVAGHGCVITPITLMLVMMNGNSFMLWPFALAAMLMVVVTNLAAMPLKYVIPIFAFSVLLDIAVIIGSFAFAAGFFH